MRDTPRAERFLKACRREPVDATPIWIMRQAGRYLPEYRQLREKYSFLDLARSPELVAQVTMQPLRRMELDAAILFADIALPLAGLGVDFRLEENVGPVIDPPVRTAEQIHNLREFDPERDVPYVIQGVALTRRELDGEVPLIGFSGAPFTLASYMVEGRGKRDYRWTKSMMYSQPVLWHELMERLTTMVIRYLRAQADAGAQALQVFDSWIGCLSGADYVEFVKPHSSRIFSELSACGAPIIHFGTGAGTFIEEIAGAGGDVIGVDWRLPLQDAWRRIGAGRGIQGNLDPCDLFGDSEWVRNRAGAVLDGAGGRPGHIFNLGHGVLPGTPLDNVKLLVDFVHERSARL